MSTPTKILVPTDFSRHADEALRYAVDLAAKLGATVHVVHAYEIPVLSIPDAPWVITSELVAAIEKASRVALDALVEKHGRANVTITSSLLPGDPRSQIEVATRESGADLLCMGTHGRRGLVRALLGSVAEHAVRTSVIPVLTVHAK